jgi:predicted CXXCH cytochrome family protein
VAPSADPTAAPTPDATAQPATPGLHVTHYWVGKGDKAGQPQDPGTLDAPRTDAQPYILYTVRFQVLNSGSAEKTVSPTLQYADAASTVFAVVPALNPVLGTPFYVANDEGDSFRTRTTPIAAADLRLAASVDAVATAVDGEYSGGPNPAKDVTLPAHSFTEIEFAVRVTGDTEFLTGWLLRLDLGSAVIASADASVALGAEPPVVVPPNQKFGVKQGAAVPLYRLQQPGSGITPSRAAGQVGANGPVGANPPVYLSPHQPYGLTDDSCAACHAAHRATGKMLLQSVFTPISTLCFKCHDGTGSNANVQAQFANPALPANNPATASYYAHPATTASNHQADNVGEFAAVSNRHSECTDCHQPHLADATTSVQVAIAGASVGWSAGGPIKGAAGVAVTNGAANTAPTYALVEQATYEYQLCFKCHSGYTTLPVRSATHPSWLARDKAIELNPANVSFHPIEAKGTNPNFIRTGQTVGVMDQNLAGTSTYKTWTFTSTSTIRCANCHGSSGQTQVPANAGATSDTHASINRGLLLKTYRDRVLKPRGEAYSEAEFALCFMCHTNTPFLNTSSTLQNTSNFRYHGYHTRGIATTGNAGSDIDVDGIGTGNALCAECHFQMHGSTYPGNAGATQNGRLVNFAPDVQPLKGVLSYTPRVGNTAGRCTLICHTKEHSNLSY